MRLRRLAQSFRVLSADPAISVRHWYATVDLPAGTVIDFIGVNTNTTVDAAMGFTLHFRDHLGGTAQLASASFPAHDFATDLYGPLGILIPSNIDRVFVLDVEVAPGLADYQFFGFVEVWWRRVVSDAAGHADVRRRADVASVLPVHRGAREVGDHRWMRERELLSRQSPDARARWRRSCPRRSACTGRTEVGRWV